ncbi:hypothetical protein O181_118146 [Austropuccinia psidii MF-1]|uniref:Uncharacterized protein n=1 Tax=Austropuccinia psidii MF-1 TaxID=1389203 RepID=A0A9Q3KDB2_9BASI|nr:hypothetical protein [Austropuccinia psidii MF-1]
MTTRRGFQYCIQSDGGRLRRRVDPSKGIRKGKIPSGTESTQGSAISKRQFPDMSKISEPELELSVSNSNRDKSHPEGSNRHLYLPVQAVFQSIKGKRLGNFATNPPRSDNLLAYPEKIPQRRGNSEILQRMESTIIQASNQEDKGIPCQKEGGKQGRSPGSFYQKASSQSTSPRRGEKQEKELEETIFSKLQDLKNPTRCHGQCLQHGLNLV